MRRALPILLLAGLGACAYNPHEDFAPDFGESVHANIASQVVNPIPLQPSGAAFNNGPRMDGAYQRYQTNRIYRPMPAPSLQAATGGVSSAGGSSSGGGDSGSGGGTGSGSSSPY